MALRIDRAELRNFATTQGFLRADGWLTRSGVFLYLNPDGSTRREYRPPSEVFDAASLDTLPLIPVTDDHPPVLVTPENVRQFQVGKVGEDYRPDGRWVRSNVQVDDAIVQAKIRSGKSELSMGYVVDYDPTPGVTPEGERYDGIQKNIRYNHLAVVDKGRASDGTERAALKLDAAIQLPDGVKTVKVKINGARFDVEDDCADALDAERETVQKKLDSEKARADVAEDRVKDLEAKLAAANDSEKFDSAVKARVKLERTAGEILEGEDLSTKTDREIQEAAIAKLRPHLKLDGASDIYVAARFDAELDAQVAAKQKNTKKEVEDAANSAPDFGSFRGDVDKARQAMIDKNYGQKEA